MDASSDLAISGWAPPDLGQETGCRCTNWLSGQAMEGGTRTYVVPVTGGLFVDELQKVLTRSVFHYATDKKKAAGRALGTLVEVITFYLLQAWDLRRFIAIERPLPEYANDDITHSVEYSLHPSAVIADLEFSADALPLSVTRIARALDNKGIVVAAGHRKTHQLLSSDGVLRNACTVADEGDAFLVATLTDLSKKHAKVSVSRLLARPFALAECKRVGVEEGTRKGPQSIEKAKQGAYVARAVSSLQKIRLPTGETGGCFVPAGGQPMYKKYDDFIREIIDGHDRELLRGFILTIGIVSNHGNWFTSDDPNKELKVLAQSYDWLLFLTDKGLAEFISDLILKPAKPYEPVRKAFLDSYTGRGGANRFTKVQMASSSDRVLRSYFKQNIARVESWFNVIAPRRKVLALLREELYALSSKNWTEIQA